MSGTRQDKTTEALLDPVSAVGVASAVVQFVDFSTKLVSGTIKIYRVKQENRRNEDEFDNFSCLQDLTQSLLGINERIDSEFSRLKGTALSANDEDVARLCRECNQVANELLSVLKRLKSNAANQAWSSFVEALRTVWSESEIESLKKTLDSFRAQISMHTLVSMREEVYTLQHRQSSTNERLVTTVRETQTAVRNYLDQVKMFDDEWKQRVLESLNESYSEKKRAVNSGPLPAVSMEENLGREDVESFSKQLLLRLQYREMDYRYEVISQAYAKTFEWIFRPPESSIWSNFVEWLTNEESLYWITGKPAAGKSTLLKFIYDDTRTKDRLRQWAARKELIVSSFYFWHAGTSMQMSQEGFARTLLHSALVQAPDLIPVVFPQRMETFVYFGHRLAWEAPWTWRELLAAIKALVKEASKSRKLFFFIDGLDEFNGGHKELVELVQSLLVPNTKICVSSRPWNVFEDGFRQRPSLRVEDLTSQDIRHYVHSRCLANPGFNQLHTLDPDFANQLLENVTQKSQGVFLWVSLVTNSLLEGLSDGERLMDLQNRLDSLPQDLEALFNKILTSLTTQQMIRTSQILQILKASLQPMTLMLMSFADEENFDFARNISLDPIPLQQADARAKIMRRRLNACCKGLVEASWKRSSYLPDAQISFLHRAVKDYFDRPEVWSKFVAMAGDSFYPELRLCNAYLAMLKISSKPPYFDNSFWHEVGHTIEYALRAEKAGAGSQIDMLNELDRVAAAKASNINCGRHWSTRQGGCEDNRDFLHLAVQCQLWSYIKSALSLPLAPHVQANLHSLLHVATCKYRCHRPISGGTPDPSFANFQYVFMHQPHVDIIKLLLERGADPNKKLNGLVSTWEEMVTMETYLGNTEIIEVFLEYGADPKVWIDNRRDTGDITRLALRKRREARISRVTSVFWSKGNKI